MAIERESEKNCWNPSKIFRGAFVERTTDPRVLFSVWNVVPSVTVTFFKHNPLAELHTGLYWPTLPMHNM